MGAPMLDAVRDGTAHAMGFDVVDKGVDHIKTDLSAIAPRLETLFSVVRDANETDALLFETQNLIAAAPALRRIFICSTLSPRYVKALRARVPAARCSAKIRSMRPGSRGSDPSAGTADHRKTGAD